MRKVWVVPVVVALCLSGMRCGTPLTENELVQKAYDSRTRGEFTQSVELFEELVDRFPDSEHIPNALFLMGFITANDLEDPTGATRWYNEFISLFPDHELASSVTWELENLGKSPDEVLRFLQPDSL